MKIYFVRHGETEWNRQKRYQGSSDIPLNEVGRQQAHNTARDLHYLLEMEDGAVNAIYSSDLSRAMETATIIGSKFQLTPVYDKRLREISFGVWEGLTFNEVYECYQTEFDCWFKNPFNGQIPGGESLSQVIQRALEMIDELSVNHKGNTIIVVTHGGIIKSLRAFVDSSYDIWNSDVKLASVTKAIYEKGALCVLNQT